MGGKINAYLDCVSPYSYFALIHLRKNRKALASHNVQVEFHPVFLGGINVGSGNKPPWTLPAKAAYSKFDNARAQAYFGVKLETPSFFPILSLLPQRCMTYVKDTYSVEKFEEAFAELWKAMWVDGLDISKPELMAKTLAPHFSDAEVKKILEQANSQTYKQKLLDMTQLALDRGAFGCPWFWVENSEGEQQPFFGSDRFAYMWAYLGIPFTDIAIQPRTKL